MSFDPDEVQKRVGEIEKSQAEQELVKTIKLSRRQIWVVVLLALLIPFTTYLYTRRWNNLLIFLTVLGLCGLIFGTGARSFEESFQRGMWIGSIVGTPYAAVDNALAIRKARSKVKKL